MYNCTPVSIDDVRVYRQEGSRNYEFPATYASLSSSLAQSRLDVSFQYMAGWRIIVCDIINNGATAELFYDAKAQVAGDPYYERKTNQLLCMGGQKR